MVIVPGGARARYQLDMLNQPKEIPQTFNQILLWAQMSCGGCSKRGAVPVGRRVAQQDPEKAHRLGSVSAQIRVEGNPPLTLLAFGSFCDSSLIFLWCESPCSDP